MKFLKIFFKIFFLFIGTTFLVYLAFMVNEYFVGARYVEYLDKNKLFSSQITDSISLKFNNDFANNQLFLVGEIHEVETSPIIDVSLLKYLNQHNNITKYIAELDIAQAYYINKFLMDSTKLNLDDILKKWGIWIGQNSSEYRELKWGNLKAYNQKLKSSKKIKVYGIDKLNDFDLLRKLLKEKLPHEYSKAVPENENDLINWVGTSLPHILETNIFSVQDSLLLTNIEFNCSEWNRTRSRDEIMYHNFKRYYAQNDWEFEKIYGCFGLYHTLQGIDKTFAGRIKAKPILKGNIVSLATIYTNSHLTVPSQGLPFFIADKGAYTKLPFGYDSLFLFYIKGIEDFKRVSNKNTINLFKLNSENSPYHFTNRGLNNFSLLKLFGGIHIEENRVTTDYIQYVFYVNGADWIRPDG